MISSICMCGLGYIGLPTAVLFASHGKRVVGLEVNSQVVETINAGKIHIVEKDLGGLVAQVVQEGMLRATLNPEPADAFLVAVPTPFRDGFKPDLSYVDAVVHTIAPVLRKGNIVILESTSPIGTTERMTNVLAELRPDLHFPSTAKGEKSSVVDVQIAYCPERVLPGNVIYELIHNDRVIGGMTPEAAALAVEVYKIFVQGECLVTTTRTAEMCKLVENSFRDVNIAFANELSMLSDKFGVNVWELIELANRHPRVNILQPGAGVGGHCIAVDPWFLVHGAPRESRIIRAAREVNDSKPSWILEKVQKHIDTIFAASPNKHICDITVGCLGLAFKPNIDDLRESPAVEITRSVSEMGCRVLAVEPHIDQLPLEMRRLGVTLVNLDDVLGQADIICVLVRHDVFVEKVSIIKKHNKIIDIVGNKI